MKKTANLYVGEFRVDERFELRTVGDLRRVLAAYPDDRHIEFSTSAAVDVDPEVPLGLRHMHKSYGENDHDDVRSYIDIRLGYPADEPPMHETCSCCRLEYRNSIRAEAIRLGLMEGGG